MEDLMSSDSLSLKKKKHIAKVMWYGSLGLLLRSWLESFKKKTPHIIPITLTYSTVLWKGEDFELHFHPTELENILNNFPAKPEPQCNDLTFSALPSLYQSFPLSSIYCFGRSSSPSFLDLVPLKLILDKNKRQSIFVVNTDRRIY